MIARNRACDHSKINKCDLPNSTFMEASFLVQPWIAARTIADCCRLCYQERDGSSFLNCKRAHLGGYNSLLATLRMEVDPQFGDMLKQLEDCKETCLSTRIPDERCYEKMQHALHCTQQFYEQILDKYKSKYATIPNRSSSTPRM